MKITKALEERVGETMNWLHEGDERLITKKRALEAADYYQLLYCQRHEELNSLKARLLAFSLEQLQPTIVKQ